MSAGIEVINGKVAMAYAGETPWHHSGTDLNQIPVGDRTPERIMKEASLDWKVLPRNLSYEITLEGKKTRKTIGHKALVRDVDGKVLTVITKDWHPVQNAEAFDFFAQLVESGKMTMETAGSIMGGKRVWAMAKINEAFDLKVNGKVTRDNVQGFLLLTNPHEYGKSIDARLTSVRVVCQNTFGMAMGDKGATSVALNHRQAFDAVKLQEMLGVAHLGMEKYKEQAEFLASKRYTLDKATEFFAKVFPRGNGEVEKQTELSKMAKAANDIVETQPGADFAAGTWWNAFNAVTFATDHLMGSNPDTRLASAWYGHNRSRKTDAMALALDYAKAA